MLIKNKFLDPAVILSVQFRKAIMTVTAEHVFWLLLELRLCKYGHLIHHGNAIPPPPPAPWEFPVSYWHAFLR